VSDWQDELLVAADPEVVLTEGERAWLDDLYGVDSWRDWTRQELYVVCVFTYAQELAFELLGQGVPPFVLDDRIGPVLNGLDRERR
jgi:hypothetical protein